MSTITVIDQNGRVFRSKVPGAPTAYEWRAGDIVVDALGAIWRCFLGGNPGSWDSISTSGGEYTSLNAADRSLFPTSDYEDWNSLSASTSTDWRGKWWLSSNGAGAGSSIVYPGDETSESGVLDMVTGSTATGRTGVIFGYNQGWEVTMGSALIRAKCKVHNLPNEVGETFGFNLGLMSATDIDATGSCFLAADASSAYWMACYRTGAGLFKAPTSVLIEAGVYYDLCVTVNASGDQCDYYIGKYGVGEASATSSLVYTKSATFSKGGISYGMRLQKATGVTTRKVSCDWIQGILSNKRRHTISRISLP